MTGAEPLGDRSLAGIDRDVPPGSLDDPVTGDDKRPVNLGELLDGLPDLARGHVPYRERVPLERIEDQLGGPCQHLGGAPDQKRRPDLLAFPPLPRKFKRERVHLLEYLFADIRPFKERTDPGGRSLSMVILVDLPVGDIMADGDHLGELPPIVTDCTVGPSDPDPFTVPFHVLVHVDLVVFRGMHDIPDHPFEVTAGD